MVDKAIENMAKLLVHYSTKVKKGDYVLISGEVISRPLLMAIYKETLKAGANPQMLPTFDEQSNTYLSLASDEQLQYVSPLDKELIETVDVTIDILSELNVKQNSSIDPARMAMRSKAKGPLMERFMERQGNGELRWVLGPYATQGYAQEAGMSLDEYQAFITKACHLDKEDPVAEWERISAEQKKLCNWLGKREEFRFVGRDTDLTMSCGGRVWINCDGDNNMPDGEVFTGPVEDSAAGTIRFTYPGIYAGVEVEDIRLTFKDGKVVEATASKGQDMLEKMIDTDEGSRFIGEIAIGTNYGIQQFTKNMLFDEKIGGTMHLALGAGYPESGSTNVSAIHWDILKDMKDGGRVYADGELFYENGKFLISGD
jgi:aminopeptidase